MLKLSEFTDYNCCMHCDTQEKADIFLEFLHKHNRRWCNDTPYLNNDWYFKYNHDTVQYFNDGSFGTLDRALANGDTVLRYDDYFDCSENIDDIPEEDNRCFEAFIGGFPIK